jgi:hypothetical protein
LKIGGSSVVLCDCVDVDAVVVVIVSAFLPDDPPILAATIDSFPFPFNCLASMGVFDELKTPPVFIKFLIYLEKIKISFLSYLQQEFPK